MCQDQVHLPGRHAATPAGGSSLTFLSLLPQFVPSGSAALPRTLLLALIVCALALARFQVVALLVDRLGRWLRRPRAVRTLWTGTGVALTALGAALLLEPFLTFLA